MRKIIYKIGLIFLFGLSVSGLNAQTLKEFIQIALENNYKIRIEKNQAQISANNNTLGNAGMLPTVGLDGTYTTSSNTTRQVFADGSVREGDNARNSNVNLSVLANWTVFNGFSVHAQRDQLGYLEDLGATNARFYIEETVSDLVLTYYQLVFEKQLLDNYQQSLEISRYRKDIEDKRRGMGAGTLKDYGQALVDFHADSIKVLDQLYVIEALELEMNQVLGKDLEQELRIDDIFLQLPVFSKDSLFQIVKQHNSSLKQERLQELIAETELRMHKANKYPKVDLFAGYMRSDAFSEVGFFSSNQNYGPVIGVSVSFNLFDGGKTNLNIKNAQILAQNAHLSKQEIQQVINADLLKLYKEHQSLHRRLVLAESNVQTMERVYRAAEEQLKQGAINGFDFRLTQMSLLNSKYTLMQIQFTLKAVEISLNRLSGRVVEAYMQ